MKLQKIMLDAGFSCPNRDGSIGTGGCSFCRPDSFNPAYCRTSEGKPRSITEQLEAGKAFFAGKYPEMKYLAYFQAYSNSYASLDVIRTRYEEALSVPDVVGIVIGTRPDCLNDEYLRYIQEVKDSAYEVLLEIGIESFYDRTLARINRGHTGDCGQKAIQKAASYGIPICIHLIFGLPGESKEEILQEADIINALPVSSLKIHQLQILRGTRIADEWIQYPDDFPFLDLERYTDLVSDFVRLLRGETRVERYASSAPGNLLLAPRWGLKPSDVEKIILRKLSANMRSHTCV